MEFKTSKYYTLLKHKKIEKPFGVFYFLDKFVIAEMNEGVHFTAAEMRNISIDLSKHYGSYASKKLVYIGNRVHSHSVDPNAFFEVEPEFGFEYTRIIVSYNSWAFTNLSIEKMFSKAKIKSFYTLDEAIGWALS